MRIAPFRSAADVISPRLRAPRGGPILSRMDAGLALLDLAGTVALLLWGVHMVQTGIARAFGPELRRFLRTFLRRRLAAFAAGIGVTAILQSSTATALMISGFAAAGAIGLESALAVMLGANVGTTLIVQLLSFNVAGASPALLLLGLILFRRGGENRWRDLGRVAIGLGLVLLALHQLVGMVAAAAPLRGIAPVLTLLAAQPLIDVLVGAVLAWAGHSSVAIVLAVMSFAARGALPEAAAFALVLGANLGTAINPVLETGGRDDPAARRLPLGNLASRVLGVAIALPLLPAIVPALAALEPNPSRAVADFHTGFNLVLAVLFLPALGPFAALLRRVLPARDPADDPGRPRYLDAGALASPALALAAAGREALRMADALEAMLAAAEAALAGTDRRRLAAVRRQDDVLDRLHRAIGDFLGALGPDQLDAAQQRRLSETLVFSANLEAAGDALDRAVLGQVARRLKRGLVLPEAERESAARLLRRLAGTTRAAAAVFLTGDAAAARLLAGEKQGFRELEAAATASHLGGGEPIAADLLRGLKQVNSHLVAAAAYPVLAGEGALLESRLRAPGPAL